MRRIGLLLCLAWAARAGDDAPVLRVYDMADLLGDEAWFAAAVARARSLAPDAQVHLASLVVSAPAAVQERVAGALADVRRAFDLLVTLDIEFVRLEGDAGVDSVPADRLEEFLGERRAERIASPRLVCRNGQRASLEVTREVSFVADFAVTSGPQGGATADPLVETIRAGMCIDLRPIVAADGSVRLAAKASVTEVAEPMPVVDLPVPLETPLRIQVPEATTHTVSRALECRPDAFAVLDLGKGHVVLVRAKTRSGQ